eukprot:558017-Pyramimonas_sp.AAC.1
MPTASAKSDCPRANSANRVLASRSSPLTSLTSSPACTDPLSESEPESLSESPSFLQEHP